MRRRLLALSVVPVLLFGIAACGEDPEGGGSGTETVDMGDTIAGVEITGDPGSAPKVTIDEPLKLEDTQNQVITAGDGNPVVEGEKALLHVTIANATTGKTSGSTYDQGAPLLIDPVSEGGIWPGVLDAVVEKPVGSRIAVAAVPEDAFGGSGNPQLQLGAEDDVLFVVDIVSVEPTEVLDGPEGEEAADVPESAPTVVEKGDDVTGISFDGAQKKPSDKLQVIPLIEGDGPPVRDDSLVSFNYLGQVYGSDKVFDESYSREPVPFPVGIGGLIKGWDEALVGLNRGSRVMIIAPPELAYGDDERPGIPPNSTLAFVVDILGVDEPAA